MLCQRVLTEVAARPARGATKLVAIDGRGGSGKSTFASELAAADPSIKILYVDDFPCLEEEYPFHPSGVQTRISTRRLLVTLAGLSNGVPVAYQRTSWGSSRRRGRVRRARPGGTVLVEGCYSLLPPFRPLLDYAIWIECDSERAANRALRRNGYSAAGMPPWMEAHVAEQEAYVRVHRPAEYANLVLQVDPQGTLELATR